MFLTLDQPFLNLPALARVQTALSWVRLEVTLTAGTQPKGSCAI